MGKKSREKRDRRLVGSAQAGAGPTSKLEKFYLWAIEGLVYLSLFAPLVVHSRFFFPYVSPKTLFFRAVVDIMAIVYVLLVVSNRRYLPRLNVLTCSLLVFLAVITLTSITGVNFSKSFWSVFERMAGLLTYYHLFIYFIVLTSVFRERKYWERFFIAAIIVGLLLAFYVYTSKDETARGGGTIGNTSFMSAYLIFDIFFALVLFLTKPGYWKIFYGAAFSILLYLLLFPPKEPTRGAIGAFFGGIFLLILSSFIYFVYSSEKKLLKRITPIFLAIIVVSAIGFTQTGFFKREVGHFRESNSWQARAIVWKMGYLSWKERPWLGWGQENFNIPFAKYFDPVLPLTADVWYDRVHNIVFDTLVASGILGLLSYLAIFFAAAIELLKTCPKIIKKKNVFLPLGMIALLAVYFAQDIWVFDMISSYMMFFFALAFISFLTTRAGDQEAPAESKNQKGFSPVLAAPIIVVLLLTVYFGNIQPARASYYIIKGVSLPLEQSLSYFQKAIDVAPMSIFEAPEQMSRGLGSLIFNDNVNKEVLNQGFKSAAADLQLTIKQSPLDFRPNLILGRHYSDFFLFTSDKKYLEESEKVLNRAIELSPKNQQGYWSLAQTELSAGKNQEAIDLMQKAADLEPRFGISHWYLAMTYKSVGKNDLALESIKRAAENGYDWTSSASDMKKVIEIYQELEDYQNLLALYNAAIPKAPKDAKLKVGLAVTYANLGQFDKARQTIQEALQLDPGLATSVEEFIKSLLK